jgi:hypothetical protein
MVRRNHPKNRLIDFVLSHWLSDRAMPNSSKTRRLNARPKPRNDAEEAGKDGCLHLWRKAAAAGGLRRLS